MGADLSPRPCLPPGPFCVAGEPVGFADPELSAFALGCGISLGHLDSCPFWLGLEFGAEVTASPRLDFLYEEVKVTPKKRRGRPATGRDPHVTS
jgi:hypothetical protein